MIIEGKQKIWADYQKDIPDDHYFYVRSCIRQAFWPGSEVTFLDITRNKLGTLPTRRWWTAFLPNITSTLW